jgi:hypothetical protein
MALTRTLRAFALGTAFAMAAPTTATRAAPPDTQSRWAAPFPPKETIYWPECGPDIAIMDAGFPRCARAAE